MKKFTEIILYILLLIATFLIIGCQSESVVLTKPITPEVQTVIKNLSWIQMILIIGIVSSIFACFNGAAKIGIPLLISSLVGYGLTSAMLFYAKIIALTSLVGGVGLCGYMIFLKHRALKEIIAGVENVRRWVGDEKVNVDNTLANKQSSTTEKIVEKIKWNNM